MKRYFYIILETSQKHTMCHFCYQSTECRVEKEGQRAKPPQMHPHTSLVASVGAKGLNLNDSPWHLFHDKITYRHVPTHSVPPSTGSKYWKLPAVLTRANVVWVHWPFTKQSQPCIECRRACNASRNSNDLEKFEGKNCKHLLECSAITAFLTA